MTKTWKTLLMTAAAATLASAAPASFVGAQPVELGPRPFFLIDQMQDGALKDKLAACADKEMAPSAFSIGHRGAAMMFPEHTRESYVAAARMGAGIVECDVTFTKDKELVCRHAQNDLHTTTNILGTDLAANCTKPFAPAEGETAASAECRTSDITLAEFKSLKGKMDAADKTATTAEAYMDGTANWRTDLYAESAGTVMTHAESIALFKELGVKFTPELKSPSVEMPFDGLSQEDYAQKMIDEYKAAGVDPSDVFAQSFNLDDVLYWIKAEPDFGKQAVYLVEWGDGFNEQDEKTWKEDFKALKAEGVNYLAPSMNMLVTADGNKIAASAYAKAAKDAGLKIITWTLERSGPLKTGGGWYYTPINDITKSDGRMYELLNVLDEDVGIEGIFSDWPATVTYYANCMGK
ncbi:glycerophosphoryl diester phosphodiesterase [Rhodobium orientis]|uniref:glycerophosphodiester phosphodiesterase n=1 Tax=Rhodobium orientis TaxID=34017 RepID=A0A327JL80_9HYPH|nr:glycerophosphodiester phosphodiesterase family protein [Rhodobium orientis]MBB4303823.1 glycerophosphoryl diester phosphodiesterase [Rhodobium orientis]MBK5947941.1 glycerophosphodiester phosphodiesterase [Rhodobium orientis]RAI26104.1 glycerophosphodiester phosphodiesterase [Rhodobium orientis]